MIFKLETPEHQRTAIRSVVEVFRTQRGRFTLRQ